MPVDLDAAARAHAAANPPPDWWPCPPPGSKLRVWQFHPVVGPPTGGRFGEDHLITRAEMDAEDALADAPQLSPQAARLEETTRDLMDHVFPGDSLESIGRRLGYPERGIRHLRRRFPELAERMDLKRRGAAVAVPA